jgi:hypothetical protein
MSLGVPSNEADVDRLLGVIASFSEVQAAS